MLGARLEFPEMSPPRRSAKQAANEIIMAGAPVSPRLGAAWLHARRRGAAGIPVLLGMDVSCFSPWIAALITFKADDRPAEWKKRLTSVGAVGWLMTLL